MNDIRKESIPRKDKEVTKSSDEDESSLIPSIALQKHSSHSSLEGWNEDRTAAATDKRKISKSRSLESSLGVIGLINVNNGDGDGTQSHNRLTLSHSIPSLDSDSVFSIEDEHEREEGEREGEEGEREREEDGDGEEKKREIHQQLGDVLPLEISVDSQFSVGESQNEESLCTQSLPVSIVSSTSHQRHTGVDDGKEMMFSPVNSPPDSHRQYKHNRDHSAGPSLNHNNRDNSISPVDVEQPGHNESQSSSSPADRSHLDDITRTRHSVKRSNSFSSSTYRHKWRWKKALALASTSTSDKRQSTLNNADPFNLLHLYQTRSRDCCPANSTCRVDFRTFLSKLNNNSETKNYELSFEREP